MFTCWCGSCSNNGRVLLAKKQCKRFPALNQGKWVVSAEICILSITIQARFVSIDFWNKNVSTQLENILLPNAVWPNKIWFATSIYVNPDITWFRKQYCIFSWVVFIFLEVHRKMYISNKQNVEQVYLRYFNFYLGKKKSNAGIIYVCIYSFPKGTGLVPRQVQRAVKAIERANSVMKQCNSATC